jgi:hypothetical protein
MSQASGTMTTLYRSDLSSENGVKVDLYSSLMQFLASNAGKKYRIVLLCFLFAMTLRIG